MFNSPDDYMIEDCQLYHSSFNQTNSVLICMALELRFAVKMTELTRDRIATSDSGGALPCLLLQGKDIRKARAAWLAPE